MTKIRVKTKTDFESGLSRRLKSKDEAIKRFASHFFADLSISDINRRDWDDVSASVESSWKFYKGFAGDKPQIRVVKGTTHHLIIEVASVNLPFLLDSLRIELNREGLVLADVQQCLLGVVRSGKKLVISEEIEPNESLIRLEVEGISAPTDLVKNLLRVIKLVNQVVADFGSMRKNLLLWSDQSDIEVSTDEYNELLRWFYANNFTFLGYEEYEAKGKGKLKLVADSRLGLGRAEMGADGIPLTIPKGRLGLKKLPVRSSVHRPAYLDSITICERQNNRLVRVGRFVGLFTASVYNQNPIEIPLVRTKIARIFDAMDVVTSSHKGRELSRIVEILPREELFFAPTEELKRLVMHIYSLQERRIVRVLSRQDEYFANCLVYMPKDTYNTELRVKIQALLEEMFGASEASFSTYFSESALTRTHFVLRIPEISEINSQVLEERVAALTRSWQEDLQTVIFRSQEPAEAESLWHTYRGVFSPGYQAEYSAESAYEDLQLIEELSDAQPMALKLYDENGETHFKLIHEGNALPLSDIIPIIENLGAKTLEEHPYDLWLNGKEIWVHDFVLEIRSELPHGLDSIADIFEEAFRETWARTNENDEFNRLVPMAGMDHRQIGLIRTYARYFGQLQNANSQQFVADCVTRYSGITRQLYELFERRFDPGQKPSMAAQQRLSSKLLEQIAKDVVNLADDRVLRGFVEMIMATQRTNFYQPAATGEPKQHISLKLLPSEISDMPEPRPAFEIFVYSPRVEGVHLRGGKIARGGLRWSDRTEDYRTEVLGLMKAQQVKNSVIVPMGAKGGFLPKQLLEGASRDEVMAEGIACYRIFIQGLLDVTDNLVRGRVVKPKKVVCHDEDDFYLVVAADKGTATFSDIANEISAANGFWLDDAFASGGSVGYDHKVMGITAKGAWKSVQQHFRDHGHDIQKEDFTVVGVGDMSGDVFGNGMLLSKKIKLLGAFNHLHIFVDPEPDAAESFKERQRLFRLPRSNWSDYDSKLISRGGGVFDRSAKTIAVSPQMKKVFGITTNNVTPNQLMTAILKAQVDLLWNGGIGTYVKGQRESHQDVADKANDGIRINGRELRCKVVGEGGNLGLTQLARVEYCLHGGECFTDFIDNAGGVNCSDAEVNIKILLNQLLEKKSLNKDSRRELLLSMTEAVGEIVLENNYRQAQSINLSVYQAKKRNLEHAQLLRNMEEAGKIRRKLEYLPSEDDLAERRSRGQYFTAPEISVLTSYVKSDLKQSLAASPLLDAPYVRKEMLSAFPAALVKQYGKELQAHRLHRELAATQLANGMVNFMGMNFVSRMQQETGAGAERVARAFLVARDVFGMEERWDEICALDYQVEPALQKEMMMDLIRLVRRVTRWLLRNRRRSEVLEGEIEHFLDASRMLMGHWRNLLSGDQLDTWQQRTNHFTKAGVPDNLAEFIAASHHLYSVMGVVEAASRTGKSMRRVAEIFFALGEGLQLNWFSQKIHQYQANSQWQALARETLQDDLNWQQVALTLAVIGESGKSTKSTPKVISEWLARHRDQVDRWLSLQASMKAASVADPAVFTVGIRELLDLAQASAGARNRF